MAIYKTIPHEYSLTYIAIPLSLDICCFQFFVIINNVLIDRLYGVISIGCYFLHNKLQMDISGKIDY